MNKTYHLAFYLLIIFVLTTMCKRVTEPISTQIIPDTTSHSFEWVVDTLHAPNTYQILIYDIWGTNENNVWVVGHSDSYPYQIWHWNGQAWKNIKPTIFNARPSFKAITGFSSDDIWIVGNAIYHNDPNPDQPHRRFILHYDGSEWQHFDDILAPGAGSVWGNSSENLFVGCDSGIVLHKKGQVWEKQKLPKNVQVNVFGYDQKQLYATGTLNYYDYFFSYVDEKWVILDSSYQFQPVEYWHFGRMLWGNPEIGFFSAGESGLFEYTDSSWKKILDGRPLGPPFGSIYGTTPNSLFAAALFNDVYHYNGNNWNRDSFFDYYYFDTVGNIWCNNDYVFIAVQELNTSYIFRGVRKNRKEGIL